MENQIEKNRPLYLQVGFATSLLLVYMAFQWVRPYVMPEPKEEIDIVVQMDDYKNYVVEKKEEKPKLEKKNPEKINPDQFKAAIIPLVNPDPEPEPTYPNVDPTAGVTLPPTEADTDSIFPFVGVEEYPMFGNGDQDIIAFIQRNVKYPRSCIEMGIQGTVYVNFVINKKGEITNVTLARGIGCAADQEALRVIASMPNWKPGKQRNMPVSVQYNLPVSFRIK